MIKHIFPILIITLSIIMIGCKTDFDLNAPYESIPVVYGVIDPSTDTQYVKINKSFVGTGNNAEYASILDSNYYQTLSGTVDEYVNGSISQTYSLQEMWVKNIEDGIFNTDSQKVYYFIPNSGINEDASYKLNVTVSDEEDPITAETEILSASELKFNQNFRYTTTSNGVRFANAQTITTDTYLSVSPEWYSIEDGKIYELYIKFYYDEITATDTTRKYLLWNLGSQTTATTDGGSSLNKTINGESFYEMVSNKLTGYENEANVINRKIRNLEFLLAVGDINLNTYINVNKPASGVVTEKPTFTNIDNGVGIFASRMNIKFSSALDAHSVNFLCSSSTTSGYKFCVDANSDTLNILTTYPNLGCNP